MTYILFAKLFPTFTYEKHTKLPKENHRSLFTLALKDVPNFPLYYFGDKVYKYLENV
jgi:hypothetical protein